MFFDHCRDRDRAFGWCVGLDACGIVAPSVLQLLEDICLEREVLCSGSTWVRGIWWLLQQC
jgi:hypothetical protein